ncbi:MAG TPA: hypothetical protein VMB05_01385 [Solirubrobacteraceae bacterium]|nr:hypothetical protein [Solirubrobacteraceae bacterium]
MGTVAIFPRVRARSGMYESFYLRAVSPREPVGVWIRNTVQKRPGERARGSVWCTVFDASRGRPFQHKLTSDRLTAPAEEWIAVGETDESGEGAVLGAQGARGSCGGASWSLRIEQPEPELRHLPREWLYRTPLPRTKLTSPAPSARFSGTVRLPDRPMFELRDWRGMVGHNWGAEHAERWIWLHGIDFEDAPGAWLDMALGRVKLAGRMTPWIANGAISLDGRRLRLGGLGARGLQVSEDASGCTLRLPGEGGLQLSVRASVPEGTAAGWRYGDPEGDSGHDVVNCSIAAIELELTLPGGEAPRTLHSAHGGVYELGMRERDHGVPIAPFEDR